MAKQGSSQEILSKKAAYHHQSRHNLNVPSKNSNILIILRIFHTLLKKRKYVRNRRLVVLTGFTLLYSIGLTLQGEPWLGSRFAKNCAGCHAPQRINLKFKDRRCSLSCQGCHVNPNGGGLRSLYGKWNENRWLRSFRTDHLAHKKSVAPYPKQLYAKNKEKWKKSSTNFVSKKGYPLIETQERPQEKDYYWTYGRYHITAENKKHFLFQIPKQDPWRDMTLSKFDGGASLRWYAATSITEIKGQKNKKWVQFPMAADVSLRIRPFYRKLHLVGEYRHLGSPAAGAAKEAMLGSATTRSFYAMVDDMPFNTFIQGGYYRPLFGNYDPNHTLLSQRMVAYAIAGTPSAYNLTFEAFSFGTAPNVPYLNIHKIGKRLGAKDDRTEGYAINLGLRGVRYGQSVNYSYWRTSDKSNGVEVELHTLNAFLMLGRTVISYEINSLARDTRDLDFRLAGTHTLETYVRAWREIYWQTTLSLANSTTDLKSGYARQLRTGAKAFLIPGLEAGTFLEFSEERRTSTAQKIKTSSLSAQLHTYF